MEILHVFKIPEVHICRSKALPLYLVILVELICEMHGLLGHMSQITVFGLGVKLAVRVEESSDRRGGLDEVLLDVACQQDQ